MRFVARKAGEELLGDVERQQCTHAVVAKALPELGEEQDEQASRVAEDRAYGRRGVGHASAWSFWEKGLRQREGQRLARPSVSVATPP